MSRAQENQKIVLKGRAQNSHSNQPCQVICMHHKGTMVLPPKFRLWGAKGETEEDEVVEGHLDRKI